MTNSSLTLITGGSRGIGLAIAKKFTSHGLPVILASQNLSNLETARRNILSATPNAIVHLEQIDFTNPIDLIPSFCKRIQRDYGPVKNLVNAAGISRDGLLVSSSIRDIEQTLNVNLLSCILMSRGLLPGMIRQKSGTILNITSIVGTSTYNPGQSIYAASKAGILGFTRTMALEMAKKGIRVNAIAPGFTDTDMVSSLPQETRDKALSHIPLSRLAQPDEIAETAWFLLNSPYITGECIHIDGGLSLS